MICWSSFTSANPFQQLTNFKSQQLADNLFVLKSTSSNTNVGVFIGDESILLIDPVVGKANNSVLVSAIKELSDKPIKYVINTHSHRDHSGANEFYTDLGATIILNKNKSNDFVKNQTAFQDNYFIDMGNEKIDLFHIASHSIDDVIIYFNKRDTIFMGDTYMHDIYPHAFIGGSEGLYRVIKKTLSLSSDSTQLVTAHGRFSTSKSEFMTFKNNATSWYQRISELYKQGQTKKDILKDDELIDISKKFRPLSTGFFEQMVGKTLKAEHGVMNK